MRELGIDKPPMEMSTLPGWGWIQRLRQVIPKVQTYSQALTPAEVAANTTAEQTFTVTGLSTDDIVEVNKPSHQTGLSIGNKRVSAANTLAIQFVNTSGAPITPTEETYKIKSTRL